MKRKLAILMVLVTIGFGMELTEIPFSYGTSHDTTAPQPASPTPAPAPQPSFQQLQSNLSTAQQTQTDAQAAKTAAETEVQRLQARRDSFTGSDPTSVTARNTLDGDIRRAQERLATANQNLQTANSDVQRITAQVENTPEMRVQRIKERYDALIKATEDQQIQLLRKAADCEASASTDQAREACKIVNLQTTANDHYWAFLNAKSAYEQCMVNPRGQDCKALEAAMRAAEQVVKADVQALTAAEIEKNVKQTFDVSNIFTLNAPDPAGGNRRSLQGVVNTIANWMITLVSSLAVTALIIGGFMMVISGGDENRLELGKTIFTYSLIGLLVTLMSYGIIVFLQSLFY